MPQLKNKVNAKDISWGRFKLALSKRTHIMGILNRTPDSFYDGGLYMSESDAVDRILDIACQGADIIDIGGESSRPGAKPVDVEVELERTIPIIRKTADKLDVPISIDTQKPDVAREALKNGAAIINDITGLQGHPRMLKVAKEFNAPVIIMHMKGSPPAMQVKPEYDSVINDILDYLKRSIELAKSAGIDENKLIIDPGIGFGKSLKHNLEILNNLESFRRFRMPILLGVSRKSFIENILKDNNVDDDEIETSGRFMGTVSSSVVSILKGANILRAHDVKEIVQAARVADAIVRS